MEGKLSIAIYETENWKNSGTSPIIIIDKDG